MLSGPGTDRLAGEIIARLKQKQAASGPYRTLEEFLGAKDATGQAFFQDGMSLLEGAISDAGINTAIAEFSSQWLTQADIMTALAPILFPRSDTFVIRTYGDVVNPVTGLIEGRAWCEALVQRLPSYCDATQAEETATADLNTTNQAFGRRFKIVSFLWLTQSDI